MRREIDAPRKEWLPRKELALWLGVGVPALNAMIRTGEVPPPVKVGHKTYLWHWRDAVAISIMLTWRQRVAEAHEKNNGPQ